MYTYVYMYIYIYIHMYTYIYIYMSFSVYCRVTANHPTHDLLHLENTFSQRHLLDPKSQKSPQSFDVFHPLLWSYQAAAVTVRARTPPMSLQHRMRRTVFHNGLEFFTDFLYPFLSSSVEKRLNRLIRNQ